ncbi:AGL296Wp [Eremothecium gossypii ATCC 10895]|uniref:LSM complex subunit LSM4 n=1 Tax=Eremothecium gossypii (strain ATCC 10895 / CBS 109.51 / FGSC 9923 / NRRL Y-1056) TaxID=284811 RepID=Q751K2_EREGS|nr:AGL296Wp [Eremothecium gossypii ATCC 10895]AAS54195.1 AGL296Wp [Eremothecium gossypii ATCC 10895]AEY98521.1 FAGL296Wp [Eremothecium gossypii FDAG1]
MLPLYLLTNAKGQKLFIELKNGETIEGELVNVDNWMNLTLQSVVHAGSDQTLQLPEIYVRGSFIKYIRLQDDIIEKVKQQLNSGKDGSGSNGQQRDRDGRRYNGRREGNAGGRFGNQEHQRKRGGGFQRRDGQYGGSRRGRSGQSGGAGFVQYQQSQQWQSSASQVQS